MIDDRLERLLAEIPAREAFPPTPHIAEAVMERLEPSTMRRRPAWRLAVIAAVVATLVLAAAVAGFALGLPGLRIILAPSLPSAQAPALGERLGLGERTSLEEAAAGFDGELGVPQVLGAPDESYLAVDGRIASLVYRADPGLPALADSDIGLLVMELEGEADREAIEKLVLEIGATVTPFEVGGAPGYWIEGRPHVLRYRDPSGATGELVTRLVGNVLVWESGGVLHRIESGLGLAATLRIAESIEPAE